MLKADIKGRRNTVLMYPRASIEIRSLSFLSSTALGYASYYAKGVGDRYAGLLLSLQEDCVGFALMVLTSSTRCDVLTSFSACNLESLIGVKACHLTLKAPVAEAIVAQKPRRHPVVASAVSRPQ